MVFTVGVSVWAYKSGILFPLSPTSDRFHIVEISTYVLIQKKISQSILCSINYDNTCELNLANHILPRKKSHTIINIYNKRKGLVTSFKKRTQNGNQSTSSVEPPERNAIKKYILNPNFAWPCMATAYSMLLSNTLNLCMPWKYLFVPQGHFVFLKMF